MAKTKERYVKVKGKTKWGTEVTKWKDTKTGKILDYIPLGANLEKKGGELGISELPEDVKTSVREKQKEWRESLKPESSGGDGIVGGVLPDYDLLNQSIERQKAYEAELAEANPEVSVDGKPFRLPGEFPGTREEFNAKYGTGEEVGEDPNYTQRLGGVDQGYWMDGKWVSNMTDVDRQIQKDFYTFQNSAKSLKQLELSGGQENVTDYETTIKQDNSNFIDFEKTGTGKHWKDMSQWERLQAKVKARGNPLETAKLKMQQSTFGTTPWNQPPSVGTKLGEGLTQKSAGTKVGEMLKKDGDKVTTELPPTAGTPTGVVEQVTKQIPGSSFFPDPEQYV